MIPSSLSSGPVGEVDDGEDAATGKNKNQQTTHHTMEIQHSGYANEEDD